MNSFLNALSFLTVIRIPGKREFDGAASLVWFPVVGLVIGALLVVVRYMVVSMLGEQVAPVFVLAAMVIITGGLHLDGLADTADGLFSHRSRDEMLAIMKDSRTGAMGVIAIVLVMLMKYDALVLQIPNWVLLFAPAYARIGQVCAMMLLPYARSEGTAAAFFGSRDVMPLITSLAVIVVSIMLADDMMIMQIEIPVFIVSGLLVFGGMMALYYRRIGGITGDMVGALTEVMEAVLFMVLAAMGGAGM